MIRLHWKSMRLLDIDIPSAQILRGEKQRLVMPRRYQFDWLKQMSAPGSQMWLETAEGEVRGGDEVFSERVCCMLYQRGMLANLSLRENILLPFLYRGRNEEMARATVELQKVAEHLDIADKLDDQAGERSVYMHALISLARVMLMRPDFIIVQDVHTGIPSHRQEFFRDLFCEVVEELGAGVLYLSTSAQEGSGLEFCQSLEFSSAEEIL